jgi:hypothetical protein
MIEFIEKKGKTYKLKINNINCIFMPMDLFIENNFLPLKPHVHKHKAILFWLINGKQISYNSIKKAIKQN